MRHIFLSPHMDDAVLSAGNYMLQLVKDQKEIMIITVFTSFGSRPISRDAQQYLFRSGYLRLQSFEKDRYAEDVAAMKLLHVSYMHLGYIDGGFRKNRNGESIYPTFLRLFSGTIAREDEELLQALRKKIRSFCKKSDIVYAPIGIGDHADHLIAHRIAQALSNATYFWLDQPYAHDKTVHQYKGYREAFRVPHQTKKEKLLRCYRSQIKQLYPHGIPASDELFLTKA